MRNDFLILGVCRWAVNGRPELGVFAVAIRKPNVACARDLLQMDSSLSTDPQARAAGHQQDLQVQTAQLIRLFRLKFADSK
jgi:hypothetical protein